MTNTYTKSFSDGAALTEAMLNTGFTTVKPSLSNMALMTTGSSANQVLKSNGNAVAPEFDDIGDILASGTMTAAGANAVLAAATSVSSTLANLVGNAMTDSGAQAIAVAMSSTGANTIVDYFDSSTSISTEYITGVADTSAVPTGGIGEYFFDRDLVSQDYSTTATWQDMGSISLTAGDWDLNLQLQPVHNGSTCTEVAAAISLFSGTTVTDHNTGDNVLFGTGPNANAAPSVSIVNYRLQLSGTTTIYFKSLATFSAGTPKYVWRGSARRAR